MTLLEDQIAQRYLHKREIGVPLNKRGTMESVYSAIESGFAEKFACEYFGCKFDSTIYDGGDPGYDFILGGKKIDAKWIGMMKHGTPRQSGRVIVDIGKLHADVYVAVIGSRKTNFHLAGWCTCDELVYSPWFVANYKDKRGRNIRYAIHTKDLHPIRELLKGL